MGALVASLLVLLGLALLTGGGELLVQGATSLAKLAGLTPAVIGLTVVAMGTSLPELVVSLTASFTGSPDIAVGNVVGSNILNILLILGPTALVAALPIRGQVVSIEWPFMFFATVVGMIVMHDFAVDRFEGVSMVVLLAAFVAYMVRLARAEVEGEEEQEFVEEQAEHSAPVSMPIALGYLVGGCALLFAGGRALVTGAVDLALLMGMTERVIGLTVVAFGTSAPELVTSILAARKGHPDVAVGNIIGSNIFNILGILGASAAVLPLKVAPGIVSSDIWWMAGAALVLLPLMLMRQGIDRPSGAILTIAGVAYLAMLVANP